MMSDGDSSDDDFTVMVAAAHRALNEMHVMNAAALNLLDEVDAQGGASNPGGGGDCDFHSPKQKQRRTMYARVNYENSAWGRMLAQEDKLNDSTSKEARVFRARFRVTYKLFVEIVRTVDGTSGRGEPWFSTRGSDAAGRPTVPLNLKVCPRGRCR